MASLEGRVLSWVPVCGSGDIEPEGVIRFDYGGASYAIYRSGDGRYFATDGLCTHENIHLADGFVFDDLIECPKHNGLFNYETGEARGAPVCINLMTYPTRVENGTVFVGLS